MKQVDKILQAIQYVVRPLGFAQYKEDGSLSLWFVMSLVHFASEVYFKHKYWSDVITSKRSYFGGRPFQLMLTNISTMVSMGCSLSNLLRFRHPLKFADFKKVEKELHESIDYDVKFLVINLIIIPILKMILHVLSCRSTLETGHMSFHQAVTTFFAVSVPEVLAYVGIMYYSSQLFILRQQLRCVRKSKFNLVILANLHDHLLTSCTAVHRAFRHQVMFSIFTTATSLISDSIYMHERLLGYVNNDGSIYDAFLTTGNIAFSLQKLYNVFSMCQSVQTMAQLFLDEAFLQLQKSEELIKSDKGSYIEIVSKELMDSPIGDYFTVFKGIQAYVISRPRFNTSIGGYFSANLSFFLNVVSSTILYYLLMVQMNVIKSKYYYEN